MGWGYLIRPTKTAPPQFIKKITHGFILAKEHGFSRGQIDKYCASFISVNKCKLTFDGYAEGELLDIDSEEVADGELLGNALGLFDSAIKDCNEPLNQKNNELVILGYKSVSFQHYKLTFHESARVVYL